MEMEMEKETVADLRYSEETVPLDLTRPDLGPLVERYAHRLALMVGRRADRAAELGKTLRQRGFLVTVCEGPGRVPCPLLAGRPCPLREAADVTIAFVEDIGTPQGLSSPKVACAGHSASPAVIAVEGSYSPERRDGRYAVLGALRRASNIADAAEEILD